MNLLGNPDFWRTAGEVLLVRLADGVVPTEAGLRLYDRARQILEQIDDLETDVKGLVAEPQGRVSVTLPGMIGGTFISALIQVCRSELPKAELKIHDVLSHESSRLIETGQVDFGVIPTADELPNVTAQPVLRENLFLVRAIERPGPVRSSIEFAKLAKIPLVLGPKTLHLRRLIERTAQSEGVQLQIAYDQQTVGSIAGFVRAGLAATIANSIACGQSSRWGAYTCSAWLIRS